MNDLLDLVPQLLQEGHDWNVCRSIVPLFVIKRLRSKPSLDLLPGLLHSIAKLGQDLSRCQIADPVKDLSESAKGFNDPINNRLQQTTDQICSHFDEFYNHFDHAENSLQSLLQFTQPGCLVLCFPKPLNDCFYTFGNLLRKVEQTLSIKCAKYIPESILNGFPEIFEQIDQSANPLAVLILSAEHCVDQDLTTGPTLLIHNLRLGMPGLVLDQGVQVLDLLLQFLDLFLGFCRFSSTVPGIQLIDLLLEFINLVLFDLDLIVPFPFLLRINPVIAVFNTGLLQFLDLFIKGINLRLIAFDLGIGFLLFLVLLLHLFPFLLEFLLLLEKLCIFLVPSFDLPLIFGRHFLALVFGFDVVDDLLVVSHLPCDVAQLPSNSLAHITAIFEIIQIGFEVLQLFIFFLQLIIFLINVLIFSTPDFKNTVTGFSALAEHLVQHIIKLCPQRGALLHITEDQFKALSPSALGGFRKSIHHLREGTNLRRRFQSSLAHLHEFLLCSGILDAPAFKCGLRDRSAVDFKGPQHRFLVQPAFAQVFAEVGGCQFD